MFWKTIFSLIVHGDVEGNSGQFLFTDEEMVALY